MQASKTNSHLFYTSLKPYSRGLSRLFAKEAHFRSVPVDWVVVITDIENSSDIVLGGKQQTVNMVATGSIVAALNVADKYKALLPFFFGGDGATILMPNSILQPVLTALQSYQQRIQLQENLHLRVGYVQVQEIYEAGHRLAISKIQSNENFIIPVVIGSGLAMAEEKIKGDEYSLAPLEATGNYQVNLDGMQCRWDEIAPPEDAAEIVSLLVVACDEQKQLEVFRKVVDCLDAIYGDVKKRQPISLGRLKLTTSLQRLVHEVYTRVGKVNYFLAIKEWLITLVGRLYFKTQAGRKYLNSLVDKADTVVIDGKINTVISGTKEQREKFSKALDAFEQEGILLYGLHVSTASVMSCYVKNMDENHIHFVDGAGGGYTNAARMLKQKLQPKK